ncbi:MAG: FAD-dependent oxidoreductase [Bacteroidetes bacterium]|nr:FAD-dependent oxidoreductase [Bacteroidota bacterium]
MAENLFNIVLNDTIVKGIPGETILELAQRHGVTIPTLCHDDRLEPFTSCFLCVVEVEGMRGHQPACSTKISEGMKIITDNEGVRKSRKMALELMLSNHYADCLGPCKQTCPAGVDVQGYISLIDKGMYNEAIALIKETNPLPAICGRVCVRPCEAECRRNMLNEGAAVGIDYLKRFAADYDLASATKFVPEIQPSTGKKVAVIGAGPGGLSAGYFLQTRGHQVDIFEAAPKSGGWLRYGIPEYRLPNDILDQEVKNITDLGVNIFYNEKFGDNVSYQEIRAKYDALILTIGSQKGTGVGCEGDDAMNVYSGIDFLKNMEITGQRYDFSGKTIAVVGGGNTAMDCCRTSIRCNGKKVYVIYRRTEKEMPANPIEIHESKLEGVEYMFLTLPKKINKDENGAIKSITCLKMELGEPDASGRRRPVPLEGSEFDVEVDYVLAAIGQKTDVNFIDDINKYAEGGELKINRWGDIDVEKNTLQTGIPSVFAAGDGVSGPATIIEAIAQARIASESAHQFMMGLPIIPNIKPFTSKKENFKKQVLNDYTDKYINQSREEMPVLPAENRHNFTEVELGYSGEEIALHEAKRCLECGCVAFMDCDLQKYATEYGAIQKQYEGEYKEYPVDFSHPYIEIDNNKCILCARCVRICHEVAGANALGLVNRGFDTIVAPSLGGSLLETTCESCGMCISTCPTGAISENVIFKPGPVRTEPVQTICNYCSVGCSITLNLKNGFVMNVTGNNGLINPESNLCRYPKFGYHYLNDPKRILHPMKKVNGEFREISFKEAFILLEEKTLSVNSDENAFFAGARLTNEEMYLVQKLARAAAKTNNVGSFHYLGQGEGHRSNCDFNVPFDQIGSASRIYLLGTEINKDHAVTGFLVNNGRTMKKIPVTMVTVKGSNSMEHKVDEMVKIKSYYFFIKAVNHYLLSNHLENALFIKDRVDGFEEYKNLLLAQNFDDLWSKSGVGIEVIKEFAENYNNEINAILIFSEKEISSSTGIELFNLAMITGKLSKTANGLISLKEKNNAQGIFDMGITPDIGTGGIPVKDPSLIQRLKEKWNLSSLPGTGNEPLEKQLENGNIRNLFIFGEDPLGCAIDKKPVREMLGKAGFIMVQDYFMTETAAMADLVLPASFPAETGGSYTNTQKVIQEFEPQMSCKTGMTNIDQLNGILLEFGFNHLSTPKSVLLEIISLLPKSSGHDDPDAIRPVMKLKVTGEDDMNRMFSFGCDVVVKYFEEEFEKNMN